MIKFTHNGANVQAPLTKISILELKKIFPDAVVDDAVIQAKWDEVRKNRDDIIVFTDWTQIPDAPLSADKKAEFATYRQALRDIPQNVGNPDDVVWPEKPVI